MMAWRTCAAGVAAFAYHGGALDVARRLAPGAPQPWIDLSTGINPHAYPLSDLEPEAWRRLPAREALAALEAAAARRYGSPPEAVIAGPGSQALIQTLSRITPPGAIGVLGPTYGGHAEAFAAAGAGVVEAASLDAFEDCDVAIVVNPNNPDGRVTSRADLMELHERLGRRRGLLIVDEAFADFDGADESLLPALPTAGAVVLRSFGKTFGLAGLRLGFAIASPDVGERLRAALGHWPVSGPAIAIGAKALVDLDWTAAIGARLAMEATRLDALLKDAGWRVLGGTRLFRLAAREDAGEAFERLLRAGILTRLFPNASDRLRFGIPGEEAHWGRLAAALDSRT
jgi:cobalamin biosynthesis protein CobC